jgi:aspartyl protease
MPSSSKPVCLLIVAMGPMLGSVNLQVREGCPIVDGVYVNGHGPYRFLLDTGTQLNHLDPKLAKSIGLKATIRVEVISAFAVIQAPAAEGIEIALESVRAGGQKMVFSDLEAVHQLGFDIKGVLGQEFLSRFDYLLDLRAKRLEFSKQDRVGIRAEFQKIHGQQAVSTSLGWLLLDSGTAWVVVFGGPAAPRTNDILTLAGSSKAGLVPRRPLVIEGRTIRYNELVAMPGSKEAGVAGLLPVSLFKRVYVCNSEGYVVLD